MGTTDDGRQTTVGGDEAVLSFADASELAVWLAAAGVPLAAWGQAGHKSVGELWAEVVAGETTLRADPPGREVRVAQMLIRRGGRVLMEIEQEMADGRRQRDLPPSEKLKGGETPLDAARRGLAEELGVVIPDGALCEEGRPYRRTVDSPSYPGLPTTYCVHTVALAADDLPGPPLPDADFWRDNAAPTDPIRRHLWGWR